MTNSEFERMSNKYYDKILRWANYKWGDLGDDAVQEAFLRAFEHKNKFNDSFSFVTWVYSFIPIIVANWRREDKLVFDHSVDVLKLAGYTSPESYVHYNELIELCNQLPDKQKTAIISRIESGDGEDPKNLWWAKQIIKKAMGEE